ncbi:MAG: glycoside hydrolase 43 family protein [Ignavibacteriales bacterium]|nr:glycoside hydrolase 43 family protein [Ignavibacteriales bacterium]
MISHSTKRFYHLLLVIFFISLFTSILFSQSHGIKNLKERGAVWIPDSGNEAYTNPIIQADYSDPDAIRVGDDYYMTSSSFAHFPGLPILHSKDLVNWKIIAHAVSNYPLPEFNSVQHGNGIWAPAIRFHKDEFYIYFGDPDNGVFMTKAKDPRGPWEPLQLIRKAKGWIDTCPFWDEDGNAYLVHAWARSRSGIKHIITVNKMSTDGKTILDDGVQVFCDSVNHNTMEGPKVYKRNGFYYIFAPAGGVKPGWQTILRSKNIYGPYEAKIVLEQGSTKINGPHQGAWVQTQTGEDWFIHFQDRYAYGRIIHLQPMRWETDWPVMGEDYDKNGIGEPVAIFKKPNVGKKYSVCVPQTNDEFSENKLGLQWQWQSNFSNDWVSLKERKGWLRFYSQPYLNDAKNIYMASALLMQKFPAPSFEVVTKVELSSGDVNANAGIVIFGYDYARVGIKKTLDGNKIFQSVCINAEKSTEEKNISAKDVASNKVYLKATVLESFSEQGIPIAKCKFSFSADGKSFEQIGNEFLAKEGRWVGAKIGLFSESVNPTESSFADFDWFRFK